MRSRTGFWVARVLPPRDRARLGRDRKPQVRETGGGARRGGAGGVGPEDRQLAGT